jgi:hypothetical protein
VRYSLTKSSSRSQDDRQEREAIAILQHTGKFFYGQVSNLIKVKDESGYSTQRTYHYVPKKHLSAFYDPYFRVDDEYIGLKSNKK